MVTKNFDKEVLLPDGKPYSEVVVTGDFTAEGRPIFKTDAKGAIVKEPVTYGRIISNLLQAGLKGEKLTAIQAIGNWNLMHNIATGGDVDISPTDLSYIEKLLLNPENNVGKFAIGQICAYLYETDTKPKEK